MDKAPLADWQKAGLAENRERQREAREEREPRPFSRGPEVGEEGLQGFFSPWEKDFLGTLEMKISSESFWRVTDKEVQGMSGGDIWFIWFKFLGGLRGRDDEAEIHKDKWLCMFNALWLDIPRPRQPAASKEKPRYSGHV